MTVQYYDFLYKVYTLKPVEFIWSEKRGTLVITFINIFWMNHLNVNKYFWEVRIRKPWLGKMTIKGLHSTISCWYTNVSKFIMFIILKWLKFEVFFLKLWTLFRIASLLANGFRSTPLPIAKSFWSTPLTIAKGLLSTPLPIAKGLPSSLLPIVKGF